MDQTQLLAVATMLVDIFKQMTVLNTSMLAAIVTLVQTVFKSDDVLSDPARKRWLTASLSSLFLSLVLSLIAMVEVPTDIAHILQYGSGGLVFRFFFYSPLVTFFLGVLFFIILAVRILSTRAETEPKSPTQPVPQKAKNPHRS